MSYQRKTRDEWHMMSDYGQGWEHELSEDTWREMRERLREYRTNCPQYRYKAVKRRIRITPTLGAALAPVS